MAKQKLVTVTGDKQIDRVLATFDDKAQKKITRKATRAGAKLVLEAAKAMVPVDFGSLQQSLKVRSMVRRRKGRRVHKIGHSVQTGEGFFLGETFYGGFLEFGTKERRHKSGKSTGQIRPGMHDFLRPALYQNKGPVKRQFVAAMREAVREAQRKGGGRL